jgi:hypothetical protein
MTAANIIPTSNVDKYQKVWAGLIKEDGTIIDDNNPLPIDTTNLKLFDTGNCTTTPLGADASWTGDWIDTSGYVEALVVVITDQDAATDGLRFEVSNDGSTPLHAHIFSPLDNAPNGHHYSTSLEAQYFRVKYTNGSTPQGTFVIDTTLVKVAPEDGHTHAVNFVIDDDHPAPIRRTVLVAKRADGDYDNIGSTNGDNLKVSVEEANGEVNPVRTDIEGGGKVAVGTTAVEVTFTGTTNTILIISDPDNTANLYVGKSNVTSAGANTMAILVPAQPISIRYDDVSNPFYVVAASAGQNFWKGALL